MYIDIDDSAPCRVPGSNRRQSYTTHDVPYQLLGGIIHIGDRAHTGHYRMFEVRDVHQDSDQLVARDLTLHDDNTQPAAATSANLTQIHHNAYVLLFRKI